jgi:hypothetical protein
MLLAMILLNMQHRYIPETQPLCTLKPTIRREYWSITTITQCVLSNIDSQQIRSTDQRLSFMWPIKVSHDGPLSFGLFL